MEQDTSGTSHKCELLFSKTTNLHRRYIKCGVLPFGLIFFFRLGLLCVCVSVCFVCLFFLLYFVVFFLEKKISADCEPIGFVNFIVPETKKQVTKELANKETILGLTAKIMTFQHRHPFLFHPVIRCQ